MACIYVHIPFCRTRCTYCGFYSCLLPKGRTGDDFVQALCREIDARETFSDPDGDSLYFGGGTPSLLSPGQTGMIAERLKEGKAFGEFTIEVNPDDVLSGGLHYAEALRGCGVNRVSMGVQSFDDTVLKRMGRRHNAEGAVKAYEILREGGFDNISLDFIFGFAMGMDVRDLGRKLESLPGGPPEHLSCYQLSIEEGSGLERMVERGLFTMPDDGECARQYYEICALLHDMGYEHYEISNWARPRRRSRHNSRYWDHSPYLGLGPGAHSLFVDRERGIYRRRWNNADLEAYTAASLSGDFSSVREGETLNAEQLTEERVMLGLRTAEGISSDLVKAGSRAADILVPSQVSGNVRIPENRWFVSDDIVAELLA